MKIQSGSDLILSAPDEEVRVTYCVVDSASERRASCDVSTMRRCSTDASSSSIHHMTGRGSGAYIFSHIGLVKISLHLNQCCK